MLEVVVVGHFLAYPFPFVCSLWLHVTNVTLAVLSISR